MAGKATAIPGLLRTPAVVIAAAFFALALGCARLAYGLVLPAMAATLQTSPAALGALGTLNLLGYLVGTVLLPWAQRRFSGRQLVLGSGGVLAASLIFTAAAPDLVSLGVLRLVSGVASAPLMILSQTLALELVDGTARGRVMGIVWGGAALGILGSGVAAPWAFEGERWRVIWAVSGVVGLLVTAAWWRCVADDTPRRSGTLQPAATGVVWTPSLRWIAVAYTCFGAGYISYFTYAAATIVAYGLPSSAVGYAWATLGAVALVSGPFWGQVLDRRPSARVLAGVLAAGALGAATLLASQLWLLVGGAALVGWCAFIAPPLMVATLVRHWVDAARYPAAFGACTVGLGLGQVVAPLVGAALSGFFGVSAAAVLGVVAFALGALAASQAEAPHTAPPIARPS